MDIDTMSAGREMDGLIRDTFFGGFPDDVCPVCGWTYAKDITTNGCHPGNCSMRPTPERRADEPEPYSTDIAAAWLVAEKIKQGKGEGFELGYEHDIYDGWQWYVALDFDYDGAIERVVANTAPLAICRAALKSLMDK